MEIANLGGGDERGALVIVDREGGEENREKFVGGVVKNWGGRRASKLLGFCGPSNELVSL